MIPLPGEQRHWNVSWDVLWQAEMSSELYYYIMFISTYGGILFEKKRVRKRKE